MRDQSRPKNPEPAIVQARRRWQGVAEVVSREAMQRSGTRSAWLADHASRPSRGVKAADQTYRMLCTMRDEGWHRERAEISMHAFISDIVEQVYGAPVERDGAA